MKTWYANCLYPFVDRIYFNYIQECEVFHRLISSRRRLQNVLNWSKKRICSSKHSSLKFYNFEIDWWDRCLSMEEFHFDFDDELVRRYSKRISAYNAGASSRMVRTLSSCCQSHLRHGQRSPWLSEMAALSPEMFCLSSTLGAAFSTHSTRNRKEVWYVWWTLSPKSEAHSLKTEYVKTLRQISVWTTLAPVLRAGMTLYIFIDFRLLGATEFSQLERLILFSKSVESSE